MNVDKQKLLNAIKLLNEVKLYVANKPEIGIEANKLELAVDELEALFRDGNIKPNIGDKILTILSQILIKLPFIIDAIKHLGGPHP